MTQLARNATVPQLRRAVSRHAFHDPAPDLRTVSPESASDVVPSDAAASGSEWERRACAKPELSMHYDRDGRFQLRYSAPATIGALVEQAVKEAKDALLTHQRGGEGAATAADADANLRSVDSGDTLGTQQPTYADPLAEVAHRSLAGIASTSRASHYRVYLHLDTGGGWINNGGAIPAQLLARFLTDGVLQPVWETDGRPVSVGRTMRILPARSRRLIEDRDRGCRFPGCTAIRFVEVHHLREWARGGATDVDNQVSLCPFHHDAIDRGDFTITDEPTHHDGIVVVSGYGHRLRPPSPDELAPPDGGSGEDDEVPTTYRPPTGERARWSEIELPSDRERRDTLTPQLRLVRDSETSMATEPPVMEPTVIERDPFDVIRRWDESG
ncbi:HNH endonuclease [Pedococcus bigeumensis]|nr:HNH endonuclease [Pedococcus bigeumensis]